MLNFRMSFMVYKQYGHMMHCGIDVQFWVLAAVGFAYEVRE